MKTVDEYLAEILKHRATIYGVLSIWIMFFHIARRIGVPGNPGIISPLINMGNVAVDIFLFLSGYCVHESWKRDRSIRRFYSKRLSRILVPYFVFAVPLYAWKYLVETIGGLVDFIGDILSYNFWKSGMQTTWYASAIILFYIVLPFLSFL